ncbi:hypothetical protein AVEN_10159-1 [Araneus ventricosus]|uniref:Uncharacterized protein n=1 Tax=Araneus ventricosus TaxID=182803 RepID=A0A4Y2V129_ARAVE|nr:hypothetical protein AVEN_10159-1 [Araneus ventricosus]
MQQVSSDTMNLNCRILTVDNSYKQHKMPTEKMAASVQNQSLYSYSDAKTDLSPSPLSPKRHVFMIHNSRTIRYTTLYVWLVVKVNETTAAFIPHWGLGVVKLERNGFILVPPVGLGDVTLPAVNVRKE